MEFCFLILKCILNIKGNTFRILQLIDDSFLFGSLTHKKSPDLNSELELWNRMDKNEETLWKWLEHYKWVAKSVNN